MANIITMREYDGERNLVVEIDIQGDGSTPNESVVVAETALRGCDEFRLDEITARFGPFTAHLEWDGTTKVTFLHIPENELFWQSWRNTGGKTNPKVANYTGDVNLVFDDLGPGEVGSMTLHFVKKRIR